MLYNENGSRVGGVLTCNARLYEGMTTVGFTGGTTISAVADGCTISGTNNAGSYYMVQVNAVSKDNATVTFTATYKGKEYVSKWTIKKLIGVDKYEIVTTPTAVKYDPNTSEYSSSIVVDLYRTTQNGTRTK
ncbi:MAG: hypothetical protein ACI3ZD_13840, partial [Prevotella sp.]